MRLIDADALLEAYDKAHEGPPGAARMLIEDAPTVGGWISVKDRLPEKSGDYITYDSDDTVWPHFYYAQAGVWEDALIYRKENVTHWMPLPEPPEEDKNEDH